MNVANIDLCRELYKLSGWKQEEHYFGPRWCQLMGKWDLVRAEQAIHIIPVDSWANGIPAYNLGFLLRKLQNDSYDVRVRYSTTSKDWKASLIHYGSEKYADTPEDAAVKLCIFLIKEGLLR